MKVTLTTTEGEIVLELDAEKAPGTVENFVAYVREGHYDGTLFHRVIEGFMIQGGGFAPGMSEKPTSRSTIRNEANNGLHNATGTVAMARTTDPHSATAQFFINVEFNGNLDHTGTQNSRAWGYAVFGKVTAGMDVVETRLSHLAYATEIAEAMLRRQQAAAVVAARRTIVEGAVGMVEDALEMLGERDVVELDEERKATMVSNLLVVLTSEQQTTPVVNTGSLYT